MRKIINPFNRGGGSECFGCSPMNKIGLKMEFFEDGDDVVCFWKPNLDFQGYTNVLHGGIQSTMMDEIASWVVYTQVKTAGVTASMEVKLKKTVFMDKGKIKIVGRVKELNKRFADIHTEIINADDEVCAVGMMRYFVYPQEIAIKKFNYPGEDSFFEE